VTGDRSNAGSAIDGPARRVAALTLVNLAVRVELPRSRRVE
jgi:hypothetical protein